MSLLRKIYHVATKKPALNAARIATEFATSVPPAAQIFLNYHGTDLDRFRPGNRSPGAQFRIVSVGWFKEYKGFHFVVEAVAIMAQRGIDAVLHLAGDGPQRAYLEQQAKRLGIADRVVFHGYLDHAHLVELYRDCDAFAMGSIEMTNFGRQDVIPNVIAEAMAVGLPVVATRMGGVAELLEDGESGLLVPQRDARALADALTRLAKDPETAVRIRGGALAKVRRIWDRSRNLDELAELLNERMRGDLRGAAA